MLNRTKPALISGNNKLITGSLLIRIPAVACEQTCAFISAIKKAGVHQFVATQIGRDGFDRNSST